MLREHLRRLCYWPDALHKRLTVIICDDCSHDHPADADLVRHQPFETRLYRITRKEMWNYRAAKNIAMHEAPEGWALITDIDHVLCADEAKRLFRMTLKNDRGAYIFQRRNPRGKFVRPVKAIRLMTRETYWRIGGYDESFVGTHKGLHGEMSARIREAAGEMIPIDIKLTRYTRAGVGDEPDGLIRNDTHYRAKLERIVAAWAGVKTMTFPYERLV